MSDLNDILEGEEAPVEAVEAPQEPQAVEAPPSEPETPQGEEDTGTPPVEDKAEAGLKAAAAAERKKRQEVEARYDKLAQEIESLKSAQTPAEPPAPPPSIWEDEQGALQHYGSQITQSAVQQAQTEARLQTSELLMMQAQEDFADLKPDIFRFVGENPAVNADVQNSPHPWQAAYKAYKNHQTMQQLGTSDLSEIEAKLREQITAELQQQTPAQPSVPQSLADAQSARGSGTSPAANEFTLEDILKG